MTETRTSGGEHISKIKIYLSTFCCFSAYGLLAASRKVQKLASYSTVNCTMPGRSKTI